MFVLGTGSIPQLLVFFFVLCIFHPRCSCTASPDTLLHSCYGFSHVRLVIRHVSRIARRRDLGRGSNLNRAIG
ncbi:hypothetical protein BC629DRAFT_900093 [Irpex lacteus]|nr:hypothetical protein BC629DRAFT_900093 [Irpex lacteus]